MAFAIAACEPPSETSAASSSAAPSASASPPTPDTKTAMERLHGEWLVTTPESLATARFFEVQIAAAPPEERAALEKVRDLNIRRVTTIVRINPSRLAFFTIGKPGEIHAVVDARSYVVVRASRHEAEVQLDATVMEAGRRVVLTLSGSDEIRAPELVELAGGTVWRRAGTPGVGRE